MLARALLTIALPALVLLPARGADAVEIDLRWELERSDMLRYERSRVVLKAGEEELKDPKVVTVHGHDIRDGEQYTPMSPALDDLAAMLAFRIVPVGSKSTLKVDWHLRRIVKLRVKGLVQICRVDGRIAHLEGNYTFKSRGKDRPGDKAEIRRGKAAVRCIFDADGGYVTKARVDVAYVREKLNPKKNEKPTRVDRTFDFTLQDVKRFRYKEFRDDVNAAIERGVKHLRTLQEADGDFKPRAKYKIGTTALAVLTLVACGVPRTDPAVEKALNWLFRQEPKKTYDQGVALMAVDRAYMPDYAKGKRQRDEKGHLVRDLPDDRRAWCMRTAEALERGNASPGSWSYPRANPMIIPASDSSNTQYAALGLRAAANLGYEVDEKTWMGIIRHFRVHRERKGPKASVSLVRKGEAVPNERGAHMLNLESVPECAGFRYATNNPNEGAWSSMTCAGIACLRFAVHHLDAMGSKKLTPKLRADVDEMVLGAWCWLDKHWGVDRHPGHHANNWYYYYLYSLERAGIVDNVKRVGGRDWYFEGAVQLLARQDAEKGSWNNPGKDETPQTCFALLFLKRGTTPLDGPGSPAVTGK